MLSLPIPSPLSFISSCFPSPEYSEEYLKEKLFIFTILSILLIDFYLFSASFILRNLISFHLFFVHHFSPSLPANFFYHSFNNSLFVFVHSRSGQKINLSKLFLTLFFYFSLFQTIKKTAKAPDSEPEL